MLAALMLPSFDIILRHPGVDFVKVASPLGSVEQLRSAPRRLVPRSISKHYRLPNR
jgi:hypothetical protein